MGDATARRRLADAVARRASDAAIKLADAQFAIARELGFRAWRDLRTHVMAQAFTVADRIVVLRHGRVAGDLKTADTRPDGVVRLVTGGIERIGRGLDQPTQGGLT